MKKVNIDKDLLYDQYIIQNKNIEEIAEELGVGRKPVMRSLKEFGIKKDISDIVEKRKSTSIQKYGFISPSQSEEVRQKIRQTNLERYGFENPMQRSEIRQKLKETNLEKYGVDTVLRLPQFRKNEKLYDISKEDLQHYYIEENLTIGDVAKIFGCSYGAISDRINEYGLVKSRELIDAAIERTNMAKYGVKTTAVLPGVVEKRIVTNLERYGVENPISTEEVRTKIKNTCLEKYGAECSLSNSIVRAKAKETLRRRYHRENGSQTHLSEESIEVLSSREALRKFMITNNIHTVRELTLALGRGSMPKIGEYLHKYDSWDLINPKESYE